LIPTPAGPNGWPAGDRAVRVGWPRVTAGGGSVVEVVVVSPGASGRVLVVEVDVELEVEVEVVLDDDVVVVGIVVVVALGVVVVVVVVVVVDTGQATVIRPD
jgi:hypothetical protein